MADTPNDDDLDRRPDSDQVSPTDPARDPNGDDESWIHEVVRAHAQPLLRYTTRLLAGDVERARDVVQDAFVRLCQAERIAIEDHLLEWLYTVCRNRALDVLRKERRMNVITDLESATTAATPEDARSTSAVIDAVSRTANDGRHDPAHESVERPETASNVLELLGALPANQQEVLRLKFQGGMSYKEISRITELSVSNVGFLIHTGLKKLREQLAGGDQIATAPLAASRSASSTTRA